MAKNTKETKETAKKKAGARSEDQTEDQKLAQSSVKKSTKAAAKNAATDETKAKKAAPSKEKRPSQPRRPLQDKTYFAGWNEKTPRWRLVDATGQPLGRLASQVANLLMGKDKPFYTRSADTGDFVIVVNAKQIQLTGKKLEQKVYQYHTNYPGGLKTYQVKDVLAGPNAQRVVEWAVYGMLPKGHMGRRWYSKLKVFAGSEHPHAAQKPEPVKILI